jgi:hypothetical protein
MAVDFGSGCRTGFQILEVTGDENVAEVLSQSMSRNLLKLLDIRLLTSISFGDIFRFRTARLARSRARANQFGRLRRS